MAGDINPHKLRKLCGFSLFRAGHNFGGKSSNEANIVAKTSLVSPVG